MYEVPRQNKKIHGDEKQKKDYKKQAKVLGIDSGDGHTILCTFNVTMQKN